MAPRLFVLPLVLLSSLAFAQADATAELTLDEAVTRALARAPAVLEAEANRLVAEASRKRAGGGLLPTANATTGVSFSSSERFNAATNSTVTGSQVNLQAGVSAAYDVYVGGRLVAERDRTDAELAASGQTLREQRRQVRLLATQAFYEAARAERISAVAKSRTQRALAGKEAAERRAQLGSATRSDVLRAEVELSTAKIAELEAKESERVAGVQLGRVVGLEVQVRPKVEPERDRPGVTIESALERSPRLLTLSSQRDAAEASVRAAKGAYHPSLRLSAGYDWFSGEPTIFPGRTGFTVRLGLSYPIFDGWQRDENLVRAESRAKIAKVQLEDQKLALRAELLAAEGRLSLSSERVQLTARAVEAAREDLRVQAERYELGVSTMLELLTSQENLANAETDQVAAVFERNLARAQLFALTSDGEEASR